MDRSSNGETANDERFAASANRSSMESQHDSKGAIDQATDTVKEELRSARDDVQRRTADSVNRQKHRVADRLDSIVHALHAAKQSLQDDDQRQLAQYVGDLTNQVERSTGYLRNNEYGAMMRDMENVARNNTGVFLGSTFAAGLAMGRFLRASEPDEETGGELQGDWRSQAAGGTSFAGEPGGSYGAGTGRTFRDTGDSGSTSYRAGSGDSGSTSFRAGTDEPGSASYRAGSGDSGSASHRSGEAGTSSYGSSGFQANSFGNYADRGAPPISQSGGSAREISASDALRGGAGTGRDRDVDLEKNAPDRGRDFDHGEDATRRAAQRGSDDHTHDTTRQSSPGRPAFDRETGTRSSSQGRETRKEER